MEIEKLKTLVRDSSLSPMQKAVFGGWITRQDIAEIDRLKVHSVISQVVKNSIQDLLLVSDEVIIYKITPSKDEWDTKYPVRYIYFKNGIWQRGTTVSPTFDLAYLSYLGHKCIGGNNKFCYFAGRMLGIKEIEE